MMEVSGTLLVQYDDPDSGNAAAFEQVVVYQVDSAGDKTLATLYLTDDIDGPTRDNPFNTNARGRYSFYVPDGTYSIEWAQGSIQTQAYDARKLDDILGGERVFYIDDDALAVRVSVGATVVVSETADSVVLRLI